MSMSILGLINNQQRNNVPTTTTTETATQPQIAQLKNMMNAIKTSANPQLAFQSLLNQNPQMQQVYNLIQSSGNPQQLFYELARQRGVDPNSILQQLQ